MDKTSWFELIQTEMKFQNETWDDVVRSTLTEAQLHAVFDAGWGGTEGAPFMLWTHKRVYFPACYDGSEWVASVPRNPCDEVTDHVGGG